MKKSELRKIIKEEINSMAEPTGYYTDQGQKTEENPQDIEYWLKQIEGMSLGDARDYLGIEVGLPSSMTHKVLQQHNTDIVDAFDEFSDDGNPFPSSRKGIDQLDKDDLYEISDKMMEDFNLKKYLAENKLLKEEIKTGDKVKYLEKPLQNVDYYFEYGPKEVIKVNKTTVLINQGHKDSSHPKGPKFSKMNFTINKDRIFPYSGYKKSSYGKKDGKQMWVKK